MKLSIAAFALSIFTLGAFAQVDITTVITYTVGSPSQTVATDTVQLTSTPLAHCGAKFDVACPFYCVPETLVQPYCAQNLDQTKAICLPCPDSPSTCPTVQTASCAFVCEGAVGGFSGQKFCSPTDISGPNFKGACNPCSTSSSGNSTGNGTTTTPLPAPTYTSGASVISLGSAAVLGLLGVMFAL
ncbi:hypothetical protein ABW20_dc0110488 [Dactylellina cionopaga]|nr:hypothetical protein ABW20_dc0110488 [Dactylellina cionopaga]